VAELKPARRFPISQAMAALFALLPWLSANGAAAAEQIEVCGIDKQTFEHLAFSDGFSPYLEGTIVKWAATPNLAILSDSSNFKVVQEAHESIRRTLKSAIGDHVAVDLYRYSNYAQARSIVERLGPNTIVAFVDSTVFDFSRPADVAFTELLKSILIVPELGENLVASAREPNAQQKSRSAVDLGTGEIVSTAALVNANMNLNQIAAALFATYIIAYSPTAGLAGSEEVLALMTDSGTNVRLSALGESYFRLMNDKRVTFGVSRDAFTECSAGN
jgi:hypothetical protein